MCADRLLWGYLDKTQTACSAVHTAHQGQSNTDATHILCHQSSVNYILYTLIAISTETACQVHVLAATEYTHPTIVDLVALSQLGVLWPLGDRIVLQINDVRDVVALHHRYESGPSHVCLYETPS